MPLIYIAFNAINIESPAEFSKQVAQEKQKKTVAPSEYSLEVIRQLKRETFGDEKVIKEKKKKFKGKNPLSCKKKKDRSGKEKKKKKRVKIKKQKITLDSLVAKELGS